MSSTTRLRVAPPASPAYEIIIGQGVLQNFSQVIDLNNYSRIAIISDTNVAPHWLEKLEQGLGRKADCQVILEPGERYKNLKSVEQILSCFVSSGLDRKSLALNLAGGVIGDMGGFAASIYMRGIAFIQIPTSLLAQVDASVGGKLGVDFEQRKNLVGTFAQPKAVVIDSDTLSTLPQRELVSGFAEVIKHGLIRDAAYFELLEREPLPTKAEKLAEIVLHSCKIKSSVVEADEYEQAERKILNFGHTFGHAFEALLLETDQMLLHGEAISIGMLAEAKLAAVIGILNNALVERIEKCLASYGLPVRLPSDLSWHVLQELMLSDKKNKAGKINWSLIKDIGQCSFDQHASQQQMQEALAFVQPR